MPAAQIYFSDDAYCIGFWNNVALIDTIGEIDLARMQRLHVAYRELLTRYRHMVVLCVLRPGVPVSSSQARAESARMNDELGSALSRVVFVLEEPGVFAQLFRTVIRGFNVLTRGTKLTVAADFAEAVRDLEPLILTTGDRRQLAADMSAAFTRMRQQWKPVQAQ